MRLSRIIGAILARIAAIADRKNEDSAALNDGVHEMSTSTPTKWVVSSILFGNRLSPLGEGGES